MENDIIIPAEVFVFSDKVAYSNNGVVSKKIIQKQNGNITLFAFDEGQELSEHTVPFDALVQVLDGEVEITIDHKPYILEGGQTIIMPAGLPHAVKALKKFKMLLTMIKS